jgi:hypothetical protein
LFWEVLVKRNPEVEGVAQRLVEWANQRLPHHEWTSARHVPSWTPYLRRNGAWYLLPRIIADGSIEFRLSVLRKKHPPFDDPAVQRELIGTLNTLPNVSLPDGAIGNYVKLPLAMFAAQPSQEALLGALNWFVDRVHAEVSA